MEVPWQIRALATAVEMEGESFVAVVDVRPVVNAALTASLEASVTALVGPLGTFVPFETPVSPGGEVVGALGEIMKGEFEK